MNNEALELLCKNLVQSQSMDSPADYQSYIFGKLKMAFLDTCNDSFFELYDSPRDAVENIEQVVNAMMAPFNIQSNITI